MEAGAPELCGSFGVGDTGVGHFNVGSGAFSIPSMSSFYCCRDGTARYQYSNYVDFFASDGNPIYGSSNTITPLSRTVLYYIRY